MWSDSPFVVPRPSFAWPVSPPSSDPDSGPCVCVSFNEAWQPLILGALQQLAQDPTWKLGPGDDIQVIEGRVNKLMEMFGAPTGCAPFPPRPNPPVPGDDIDCKIASYIVQQIVKQGVQTAIDYAAGVNPLEGLLLRVGDALPVVGQVLGLFGVIIKQAALVISDNPLTNWAEMMASQQLWDWIGCTVYGIVKDVHGFTDDMIPLIDSALSLYSDWVPGGKDVVQLFFDGLGAVQLNALSEVSNITAYDCSGCSDSTPVITGGVPITNRNYLSIKQGGTTLTDVAELEFETGALAGSSADAQYTPPAAPPVVIDVQIEGTDAGTYSGLDFVNTDSVSWSTPGSGGGVLGIEATAHINPSLELVQGSVDLTAVSKLTFGSGTLSGTADDATYLPPTLTLVANLLTASTNATTPLNTDTASTISTLDLPPGVYAVSAEAWFWNDGTPDADVTLTLNLGAACVGIGKLTIPANDQGSKSVAPFSLTVAVAATLTLQAIANSENVRALLTDETGDNPATWMTALALFAPEAGLVPISPPSGFAPWTEVNIGPVTVSQAGGVISLTSALPADANVLRGLTRAVSGTYSVTAGFYISLTGTYSPFSGLWIYDSVSGKSHFFVAWKNDTTIDLSIYDYSALDTWVGTVKQVSFASLGLGTLPGQIFLSIVEDGTHRTYYFSADGVSYTQFYQEAAGAYMVPNSAGFAIDDNGQSTALTISCNAWVQS